LGLVEDILRDFLGKNLGGLGLLKDTILTKSKEGLEEVLADIETDDQLLPREQRAVEEPCKALWYRSSAHSVHDTERIM
jgi:hypothetical protein